MSYARKGLDGSHVYVYGSELANDDESPVRLYTGTPPARAVPDVWVCRACSLLPALDEHGDEQRFECRTPHDMIEHLARHQAIGETVPDGALERLRREVNLLAFSLGSLVLTPGIKASAIPLTLIEDLVRRHARCDFGELDVHDWRANHQSIISGTRVLSAYEHEGVKLFIITEADRSRTTVLLRSEY